MGPGPICPVSLIKEERTRLGDTSTSLGPSEPGRGKEGSSPRVFKGSVTLVTP